LARLSQLVEQPRLADAGLAAHEHELRLAGDCGVQPLLQLRRFTLAPDEGHHRRLRRLQRSGELGDRPAAIGVVQPGAVALQASATSPARCGLLAVSLRRQSMTMPSSVSSMARRRARGRLRELVHDL
jgi:hypothetical protein